jgi:hypothetical protein
MPSSRRPGVEGDGSESATMRGGARVCELGDWKIEVSRGSIYGLRASKTCGLRSHSRIQVKIQLGSLISVDLEISSLRFGVKFSWELVLRTLAAVGGNKSGH